MALSHKFPVIWSDVAQRRQSKRPIVCLSRLLYFCATGRRELGITSEITEKKIVQDVTLAQSLLFLEFSFNFKRQKKLL